MNDEKRFIVILTRGTSAAAWQSEHLIKRLESPHCVTHSIPVMNEKCNTSPTIICSSNFIFAS